MSAKSEAAIVKTTIQGRGFGNAVDPQTYLASTLTRLINRHPASQIDQLMPWACASHVP